MFNMNFNSKYNKENQIQDLSALFGNKCYSNVTNLIKKINIQKVLRHKQL